ncbi:MAG: polysaccharide biosynthesis/export family protein [Roseiarcus sp.]
MRDGKVGSFLRAGLLTIGFSLLAGCASSGANGAFSPVADQTSPAQAVKPAPISGSSAASDADHVNYRIMPDDILQIVVYQVADFNRDAQVDATGNIALPLLGAVPVGGRTVREVEAEITSRLKAKYLQNPQVSVSVKDAVGLRVTVEGSVTKPGVVSVRGGATLLNIIAQSGGFTDTADQSAITVFRNTEKGRAAAHFDAKAIRAGAAEDPPIYGGDTVVVDDSMVKTVWKNVGTGLAAVSVGALLVH